MGQSDYYSHGNWDVLCDDCGRKYKASDLLKRWDGLMVCKQYCYEERHPQDFVRGATDKISVPWSRPENQDQFVDSPDLILIESTPNIIDNFFDFTISTEDNQPLITE
jgi:hypothetical protein